MENFRKSLPRRAGGGFFGIVFLLSMFLVSLPGDCKVQGSDKSPDLKWWVVGSGGMKARFGENFFKVMDRLESDKSGRSGFLYAIAEQPLSKSQIIKKTGLADERVSSLISSLSSIKLIRAIGSDKWATTIPVITDTQMKLIKKSVFAMAENTAKYLKAESSGLRDLYNGAKTPQDPPWKDMTHLFFCKLILDGTFHSNINILKNGRKKRKSEGMALHGTSLYFSEIGPNYTKLGCNWYAFKKDGDQREIYIMHGNVYDRYSIPMEKYRRSKEFRDAYFEVSPEGGLGGLTDREKLMFKNLGWTDHDRVLIPIVKAATVKAILPAFEKIGAKAAEIAFGNFEDIVDQWDEGPYSKFLEVSEDYVQVAIHVLFAMAAERLIEHGVISARPDPRPENFGVFFVFGKLY